jgi:hypothetical protein
MSSALNLKRHDANQSDVPGKQTVFSANGAVDITLPNIPSTVVITKGSACAITLARPVAGAPTVGGNDGQRITFLSTTAFAHTVTQTTPGFNGAGASKDVATFGGTVGDSFVVEAYNATWYIVGTSSGITLA